MIFIDIIGGMRMIRITRVFWGEGGFGRVVFEMGLLCFVYRILTMNWGRRVRLFLVFLDLKGAFRYS